MPVTVIGEELVTPREVASYLGFHVETIYKWLASGYLPGVKTGQGRNARWRISRRQLEDWLAAREVPARP